MAKFTFRLETLLKIRAATRDQRRSQLSEAYEAEQLLDQRESQLHDEMREVKQQTERASQPGNVEIEQLLNAHRYELVLEAQQQMIDQQKQKLADEIELRRQRLVEADREVRILEKLREKQRHDHQRHEHRIEIKQLDESAARGIGREDELR